MTRTGTGGGLVADDTAAGGIAGGSIAGGEILLPDGRLVPGTLSWLAGRITDVTEARATDPSGPVLDATGLLVLPGIVDLHGDAFERSLMPRPGVRFDVDLALAENDSALIGAGITTSFLSATDSWEPGLRSRETLRELVDALRGTRRRVDVRLHVRHETCNTDDLDELVDWLRDGTVSMLSYNDHTPGGTTDAHANRASVATVQRAGVPVDELERLTDRAVGRRPIGACQLAALREVAAGAGVVTASHDSTSDDDLATDLSLGVAIAEFPASIELALRYRAAGVAVMLGAPNLVRGGSHLGLLSVREAVHAGAVDVLCSDYHYPSLLQAPFVAASTGTALADAWAMVSSNPARLAGLVDRGELRAGARADVVIVAPPAERRPAAVVAVVSDGRVVHADGGDRWNR